MQFDKAFFEKHQKGLLSLASHRFTRWLLGLNRLPKDLEDKKLIRITPSSIHWRREDGQCEMASFTRPRFAEALAFNLHPFCAFVSRDKARMVWRFSPVGALLMVLMALHPSVGFLGFAATTTDFVSGSGDGDVYKNDAGDSAYATWRDAATGQVASTTSTTSTGSGSTASPAILRNGSGFYGGGRAFIPIDTSALTSGAMISAASLFLCSESKSRVTYANNNIEITESTVVSNTALATSDWNKFNDTKWATGILHDSLASAGSFNEFVLNATGYGAINKTGYSKYCVRYAFDVDNSAPGLVVGSQIYFEFRLSEYSGSSSDPYLRVVYTVSVIVNPTAETATYTDTKKFALTRGIAETVTFTDSASLLVIKPLPANETVTFTDSARLLVTNPRFAETVTFSDTFTLRNVWTRRTQPSTSWTERTKPTTNWNPRTPPS